jgi:hypothetical protein
MWRDGLPKAPVERDTGHESGWCGGVRELRSGGVEGYSGPKRLTRRGTVCQRRRSRGIGLAEASAVERYGDGKQFIWRGAAPECA